MKRREFLVGCGAAATMAALPVAAVGAAISAPPAYGYSPMCLAVAQLRVRNEAMRNFMVYGSSVIEEIGQFPFIRCVPLHEFGRASE